MVRLSGFIHTDNKLALKEIWRQLAKDRGLEDDEANKVRNVSGLAVLLVVLSNFCRPIMQIQ